jgi:NADH:ubiquinone oxidoreductase subunit E
MTNLNQLQSELAALTERVNSAMAVTEGSITLTRKQLMEIINKVQEQTNEYIKGEVESAIDSIDGNDYCELELSGNEILIEFDNDSLSRDVKDNIGGPSEITDDELDELLDNIKEA